MNAQPDWHDLAVFLAAARGGGLTGASRELGVHHATVMRRVDRLEQELGVRLFDRSPQGYALTAAGEELLHHVTAIEAEVHAIERKVAGRDQRLAGLVRVSTTDGLAQGVLPAILRDFCARHPAVHVQVDVGTRYASLSSLEADLVLRVGRPPDEPGALRRRVASLASGLYAGRSWLAEHEAPESLAAIARCAFVREGAQMAGTTLGQFADRYADPARTVVRSNAMMVRVAAVRAGLGIGLLPCYLAESDPELVRIPLALPDVSGTLWVAMHGDIKSTARVRALADHLYAWFEAEGGML